MNTIILFVLFIFNIFIQDDHFSYSNCYRYMGPVFTTQRTATTPGTSRPTLFE